MIQAIVVGDAAVVARLTRMRDKIGPSITRRMAALAIELARAVKQEKLSGQVLGTVTGNLRRSVTHRVEETPEAVSAFVFVPRGDTFLYGRAHEYGFQGTVTVKEHLRRIKQAWGRPIEEQQVTVGAHQRKMNLPERSYLRSTLREWRRYLREQLREGVREGMA